jgi:hypothetical protein
MKNISFWDVMPCILVGVTACVLNLLFNPEDGGSTVTVAEMSVKATNPRYNEYSSQYKAGFSTYHLIIVQFSENCRECGSHRTLLLSE